ncbi:MAG: hypothetical protein ACLPVY_04675 [Acidimicrobiia bacterium]
MIALNLRLAGRSMRWLGPALMLMIWILASLSAPGPALTNAGNMFLLLVAVSCWLTVAIGNVDDDGHRELLAAAIGSPARLHRSRAISAYVAANTISAAGTLACLVASSKPTRPTAEIVVVGACVLLQLAATAIGVGIGTLLHRPVLRHVGVTLLVAVAALVGTILLPPVQGVLRALNNGRTAGVIALAAAGGVVALAAVAAASALADRRN